MSLRELIERLDMEATAAFVAVNRGVYNSNRWGYCLFSLAMGLPVYGSN